MRDIVTFARQNLDDSKPINLHGLRFSRVTQKTEWMTRNINNIQFPVFPKSVAELLEINDSSNFCFIRSMGTDSIDSETRSIHYTAHQFWEQDEPKKALMKAVEKLSYNPEAYNKALENILGEDIYKSPNENLQGEKDEFRELSFEDSMLEMWRLRGYI